MNMNPWSVAIETQLAAFDMVSALMKTGKFSEDFRYGWKLDRNLLALAQPTYWSAETTEAVLAASKLIPLDTRLNRWNFGDSINWWYFEKPLPWVTVNDPTAKVRALCFGYLPLSNGGRGLPCSVWTDRWFHPGDATHVVRTMMARCPVAPSQTFEWEDRENLGEMLATTRRLHQERYGPGGPDHKEEIIGEDLFMEATEGISRFILAALAWTGQKILSSSDGHVERHRRKEAAKKIRPIDKVRVIHLRKTEYPSHASSEGETSARDYECRWVVSGHWRNQACGPKFGDRRLTFIESYPKGPEGKPFKAPPQKVFVVDR